MLNSLPLTFKPREVWPCFYDCTITSDVELHIFHLSFCTKFTKTFVMHSVYHSAFKYSLLHWIHQLALVTKMIPSIKQQTCLSRLIVFVFQQMVCYWDSSSMVRGTSVILYIHPLPEANLLTFPVVPMAGQNFHFVCEISSLLHRLAQYMVHPVIRVFYTMNSEHLTSHCHHEAQNWGFL